MTDATKPDLSREAVERLADKFASYAAGSEACVDFLASEESWLVRDTLCALLDAKEAAEREAYHMRNERDNLADNLHRVETDLTEARASAAAAWEALRMISVEAKESNEPIGRSVYKALATCGEIAELALTNSDPSATEALRRVKGAAWERGYAIGTNAGVQQTWGDSPNPYAAKEAAHG